MNIENFDIEIIEQFYFAYYYATLKFDKSIKTNDAKKQHRIRKWLYKNQLNFATLPANAIEFLEGLNDNDFISFFKSCYEHIETSGDALTQQINKDFNDLPIDVRKAILALYQQTHYSKNDIEFENGTLEILVDWADLYEEKLILFDAECSTDKEFDFLYFDDYKFAKEKDRYKLIAIAFSHAETEDFEITFSFTRAKVETIFFDPIPATSIATQPWDLLFSLASQIISKEDFNNVFNSLELALLPLLTEIKNLYLMQFNNNTTSFENIKALISKHGFFELLQSIEKIESPRKSQKSKVVIASRLFYNLNLIKYKPLWQEIYDLICDSQKEYPTYIQSKKSKNTITRLQNKATSIMREHGYSGEYPLFYKKGSLKGFHLFESYNMSYFTVLEKNPIHYIHFEENFSQQNGIYFTFSCGTEFLKRKEKMSDINSCRFNCKGKKYINSVSFKADYDEDEKISLEERINIAVKSAEFKRLNKIERSKTETPFDSFSDKFTLFLFASILSGFLFASLFIPAMMAFCAFMLWIDGMLVIINDIPWLIIYFATWAGFGIPMGIVTVFSKK